MAAEIIDETQGAQNQPAISVIVPVRNEVKAWLVALPFGAALLEEGAGWLVRFVHPLFAYAKIGGFLLLQASLAVLVGLSLWAVFAGSQENYAGEPPDDLPPTGPEA